MILSRVASYHDVIIGREYVAFTPGQPTSAVGFVAAHVPTSGFVFSDPYGMGEAATPARSSVYGVFVAASQVYEVLE